MMNKPSLGLCIVLLALLPACVRPIKRQKLMKISLGMTREQITRKLGHPKMLRGSIINAIGQVIEVFEYDVDTGKSSSQIASEVGYGFLAAFLGIWIISGNSNKHIQPFWFYFYDGRLVKWGGAGDWQNETHIIHEMRFT